MTSQKKVERVQELNEDCFQKMLKLKKLENIQKASENSKLQKL
jgi:hypothetical protein